MKVVLFHLIITCGVSAIIILAYLWITGISLHDSPTTLSHIVVYGSIIVGSVVGVIMEDKYSI